MHAENERKCSLEKKLEEMAASLLHDEPLSKKDFSNEDLSLLYGIAYGLYQAGDYEQSKMLFTQLILSKPFEGKYWQGLAATLQMQKNYTHALTAWSMVALINEENPAPHLHAAECLLSIEKPIEAIKALKEAKSRLQNPSDIEHLKEQIQLLEEQWLK